jgi:negative regulator of sigma E activity
MNKQQRIITDEHIVAYLDGELHVSPDFERDLRSDPALARSAKEYAVIGKIFAASRGDNRFMLSSQVDSTAKKMLANVIRKSRKEVRVAAPAPNAAPERLVTVVRNIKYLWAKRAAMGFALAGLAVSLWFNFNGKNEQITQVPVPHPSTVTAPEQIAPPATTTEVLPSTQYAVKTGHQTNSVAATLPQKDITASENKKDVAVNTTSQTEAPPSRNGQETKADPADMMISRRYAKMIKATRAVEVTNEDRVTDQM